MHMAWPAVSTVDRRGQKTALFMCLLLMRTTGLAYVGKRCEQTHA